MKYKILGDNLQVVIIELNPGERVYAEAGAMNHMSGNMIMEAKAKGGIMAGLKRKFLMGESFFMTDFTPQGGTGFVSFRGNVPGKIMALDIQPGKEFLVQKDGFLAAQEGVTMDMAFQQRLGSGFFGGEGFILEKLSGQGMAFIHAAGDFVEYNLQPGQVLKVSTGCVVGFDSTVSYEISRVGNIKTMLFGGEGIFVTVLRGPGKVVLQSMTIANLAMALRPYLPQNTSGNGNSLLRI